MKNQHLYESYEVETDEGPMIRRRMDVLIEASRLGEGMICPRCNQIGHLFFGDPQGEHWCTGCQVESDLLSSAENSEVGGNSKDSKPSPAS